MDHYDWYLYAFTLARSGAVLTVANMGDLKGENLLAFALGTADGRGRSDSPQAWADVALAIRTLKPE